MFASPLPRLTSTRTLVSDVCRTTTLMRNDPFPTSTPGRLCGRKSRAFVYPKALRFASRPRLGCALGNAEFSGQCSCVDGVGVDCHSKNCAVHLALTQTPKVFQAGNASGSIDGDVRRRGDLLDQGQVRSAELPFPMHCSYQNARQGEWVQPADNLLQVIIRGLLPAVGDNAPFPNIHGDNQLPWVARRAVGEPGRILNCPGAYDHETGAFIQQALHILVGAKPVSAQLAATCTGSEMRILSASNEPPTSCTQAPSRKSTAGIAIIRKTGSRMCGEIEPRPPSSSLGGTALQRHSCTEPPRQTGRLRGCSRR